MSDVVAAVPYFVAALLLVAAWRDIATRIIPDTVCVLVGAAGLLIRSSEGVLPVMVSLAMAVALFLLLLPAASRGALGGGDVKLATALLIGLSPLAAWDFIFVTVMLGGVLGIAYMAGPVLVRNVRVPPAGAPLLQRVLQVEHWRLRRRGPLPYAVAIAAGGIIVHLLPPGG
jgi:prepilin peptidase CpaA